MEKSREKLPSFEKIKEQAIELDKLVPGFTTLDSYPHFITSPIMDGEETIRESNLAVYLHNTQNGETGYYAGYLKDINLHDFRGDKEFKLVVRLVKPKYNTRSIGTVYLEERIEVGNEFFFKVENFSKNQTELYGRFLSYNVFSFKNIDHKPIELGSYVRAKSLVVSKNNSFVKVQPLENVSEIEFKEHENRIFRI